jgi:hypothetical protein
MVYIVSSYDFGGSSYVNLHIVTNNLKKAQEVYNKVVSDVNNINQSYGESSGAKYLVELTEVAEEKEFVGSESIKLHWGRDAVVNNNN